MLFYFNCPECGLEIEAEKEWSSSEAECPGCEKVIIIPTPEEAAMQKEADKDSGKVQAEELGTPVSETAKLSRKNMGIWQKLLKKKKTQTVELDDRWVERAFGIDQPLSVPMSPDIPDFFIQDELPYLWPDDNNHVKMIKASKDPQFALLTRWAVAFLHHTDPNVITATLQLQVLVDNDYVPIAEVENVADEIGWLLCDASLYERKEVCEALIMALWECSDSTIGNVLDIMALNCLNPPHGCKKDRVTAAVKKALKKLADTCPEERLAKFKKLVKAKFQKDNEELVPWTRKD